VSHDTAVLDETSSALEVDTGSVLDKSLVNDSDDSVELDGKVFSLEEDNGSAVLDRESLELEYDESAVLDWESLSLEVRDDEGSKVLD
jgi:hypothetical protein